MSRPRFAIWVLSTVLTLAPISILKAQPGEEYLLDPTTGEIDGQVATAVYPAEYRDNNFHAVLDPAGYTVHLSPNGQATELVFPCATWFAPPSDRYRIWVEHDWEMTPYSVILGWVGGPFKGRAPTAALPVAPAGRVVVRDDILPEGTEGLGVRLLRAEDHVEGDLARWEMSRFRKLGELGSGVLMPTGKVIAGLWDGHRYLALSRPFDVRAGDTVPAPLEIPEEDAFLVVALNRDQVAWKVDAFGAEISLRRGTTTRPADVVAETAARIFAVWYDVEPGTVELLAETSRGTFPPETIELQPGEIARFGGNLMPKPDLQVELDLPQELETDSGLSATVRTVPQGEIVVEAQLIGLDRQLVFEDLPARLLEVELATRFGGFSETVDLRSGEDGFLVLQPDLTVVSGTVYRGDEGHPAELTFTTTSKTTVSAEAGPSGEFELLVVEPIRFVSVALEGVEDRAPFVEFFPHALVGRQEIELHVPAAEYRLEVVDAVTGLGIEDAAVHVRNYLAEEVPEGEEDPKRSVNQLVRTDEAGWATLPPLRRGSVELKVSAADYTRMSEPFRAGISDQTDETYRVALEPLGETLTMKVVLPDGRGATGAEVLVLGPGLESAAEFSARTDDHGEVRLPYPTGTEPRRLVIRHPDTGFLVRTWSPKPGDEDQVVATLPAPAEHPLTIQVVDSFSEEGIPQAGLAVRVGEHLLTGGGLAWATYSRVNTDESGFWSGRNLPRTSVSVLAWDRDLRELAYSGGLESLAVRIDYPWSGQVDVEAIR